MKLNIIALLAVALLSTGALAADQTGAEKHIDKGLKCDACHGANNEVKTPSIDQCVVCHNPEQVVEKTKDLEPNIHNSKHYGSTLDCTLCHYQHKETELYCNQCHNFNFVVK